MADEKKKRAKKTVIKVQAEPEEKLKLIEKNNKEEAPQNKQAPILLTIEEPTEKPQSRLEKTLDDAEKITDIVEDEMLPQTEKEVLQEAQKEVKKQASPTRMAIYTLFLFINIVSFGVFLFLQHGRSDLTFSDILSAGRVEWLVLLLLSFPVTMLAESVRVYFLTRKSTKQSRPFTSYKSSALSRYYDAITPPLAAAGQAYQISYLYSRGIKASAASGVPIAKNAFNKFAYFLILAVVLIFLQRSISLSTNEFLNMFIGIVAYIGLALQALWLISIIVLSVSRRIGPAIVIGILKLLSKLKLIKDYNKTYAKVLRFVREYQATMRRFAKDFLLYIVMFALSFGIIMLKMSIPYFVYRSFPVYTEFSWLDIVARALLCELAMNVVILPGNVIFADLAFLTLFEPVFTGTMLFWALLFWRIITYYIYIVQGWFVMAYDSIKYDVLKKPLKKGKEQPKPDKENEKTSSEK